MREKICLYYILSPFVQGVGKKRKEIPANLASKLQFRSSIFLCVLVDLTVVQRKGNNLGIILIMDVQF